MPVDRVSRGMTTSKSTYHRLDIRMWHSIEFVEVKFELRANVDVSALVLGGITIFWCREHYEALAVSSVASLKTYL